MTAGLLARAIAKLHRHTQRMGADECWPYLGYRQPNGYGWVNLAGLKIAAHRLALLAAGLDVPLNQDVCHTCDNRPCVNPKHLYVGSRAQNMADCTARRRHNKPIGAAHWCAKLTDADVRSIRIGRARGMTVTNLAEDFGVNSGTISRIARKVWRAEVA